MLSPAPQLIFLPAERRSKTPGNISASRTHTQALPTEFGLDIDRAA
jgi:hypothetical protein